MTDQAILTIVDHGATTQVQLDRGGDPVSVGLRLLETGKAGSSYKREPGELAAALLMTLYAAGPNGKGKRPAVRIVGDLKTAEHAAFGYEVKVFANTVSVKATEHGKNGGKGGNGNGKVLFDGLVEGYMAALKVPLPETWERRWLVEVVSVDQDIYHRMFTATEAQSGKLRELIDALVKAKELKGGSVVPVAAFETRYSVDNLIGQLTDLVGAGAVKRATAAIAPPPAKKPKPAGGGPKHKPPGGTAKPAK